MFRNLDHITVIQGDMENIPAFAHELADCDVLFHTAAYFREYFNVGDHWSTLERINITRTIELLTTAEQQGVKKAIHTSSSGVIGMTSDGSDPDESTPPDKHVTENLYYKSKLIGEEKIQDWLKTHSMPVVIVNPTSMYGPGDGAPTRAGQILLDFIHGGLPAIPPGGFNCVDVRDVAQAMITAIKNGKSGERYILNNRYYSVQDILSIASQVTGIRLSSIKLPYPVALVYAHISEFIARFTHSEAAVPVSGIKTLAYNRTISPDKARRTLNFNPRSFEHTIRDEIQWFLENGYVKHNITLKPLGQFS